MFVCNLAFFDNNSINQKALTKPHAGKGEATSQHHLRGQQTLHHEGDAGLGGCDLTTTSIFRQGEVGLTRTVGMPGRAGS